MNCNKIQNLIATDYIDGEIDIKTKTFIDTHLKSCERCKVFYANLTRIAVEPFKVITQSNPPKEIWSGVESAIRQNKEKENILIILKDNLQALFYIPKPAYVFATAMAVVLCVGVLAKIYIGKQELPQAHLYEEGEEFAYIINGAQGSELTSDTDIGFDTAIEKYFM